MNLEERLMGILNDLKAAPKQRSAGAIIYAKEQIKQAISDELKDVLKKQEEIVNAVLDMQYQNLRTPTLQYVALNEEQTIAKMLMTGQEWYERLLKELGEPQTFPGYGYDTIGYEDDEVLEAAKRASGVSE